VGARSARLEPGGGGTVSEPQVQEPPSARSVRLRLPRREVLSLAGQLLRWWWQAKRHGEASVEVSFTWEDGR